MTEDVAVVGLGIHAFGRHPGVSGLEMAAHAVRAALADAGIGWEQVDFAAGGSDSAGNADTTVSVLGLTGVPFINVKNGCATGGSALSTASADAPTSANGTRSRRSETKPSRKPNASRASCTWTSVGSYVPIARKSIASSDGSSSGCCNGR